MDESTETKYLIGEKTYIQRKLVLGQIEQFIDLLEDFSIPAGTALTVQNIIKTLGPKLGKALAIILTEEGKSPGDKNIEAFARELKFAIDEETTVKVVQDFFALNPGSLVLKTLKEKIIEILGMMHPEETGSNKLSLSSAMEISPSDTPSAGDSP
jgi:hypothetical protein